MVKESWGAKRTCPKCETRFYDLNKDPLICPNCGNTFSLESLTEVFKKSPKDSTAKKEKTEATAPEVQEIEPEDIILDDELDEDSTSNVNIEDDLLEEEEDDSNPMEVITDVPKEEDES